MAVHPHCKPFAEWCRARSLPTRMNSLPAGAWAGNVIGAALEEFCQRAGEDVFRELFREVFLGGDARIRLIADWLGQVNRASQVEFMIVTAGTSSAVLRGLAAVPEWKEFFPVANVWDSSQARHKLGSVMGTKVMLLRDLRPDAARILLVDDSIERDVPPAWSLEVAAVEVFKGRLPYEGSGLDASSLEELRQVVASWAEVASQVEDANM